MLWSGPRSSSPGAVALEQRGDIARPWGRGMGDGTDRLPPRGVQIGIKQLFATMASLWAVPYEKQVTSAFGHVASITHITRCFLPMPRFASWHATHPLPSPTAVSFLQAALLQAGVQSTSRPSVLSLPFGGRRFGLNSDWCLANRTVVTILGAPATAQQILAQGHALNTYSTALSSTP